MRLFLPILFCLTLCCCHPNSSHLESSLQRAGENRPELERVLAYYKDNSQKRAAAEFLIENMPYHFGKEGGYISSRGEKLRPDPACFASIDAMEEYGDSLLQNGYRMTTQNLYDITSIRGDFLIKNIDLAFEVWQKPWAKDLPFEVFCRYVLPYRAQVEPLTDLREELMKRYLPLLEAAGVTTPLEACLVINAQLKKEIRYQKGGLPFYPTVEETYVTGVGQCDGLCNLGVHIMRAVGIPVAVDYIPVWTKMNLGHSWCAVWDSGTFHCFGPGEQDPGEYLNRLQTVRYLKPAKVYRKRFDCNRTKQASEDNYVTYLKNPLTYDVTHEYWHELTDITIEIPRQVEQHSKLVYLCTHNQGEWQPLAIGERNGQHCMVSNVRGDNVFIVADSPDGKKLRYITPPFHVDTTGFIQPFVPDFHQMESFCLPEDQQNKKGLSLSYWNSQSNRFESLPDHTVVDSAATCYSNIPRNALFRFSGRTTGVNQLRVFYVKNNMAVFF